MSQSTPVLSVRVSASERDLLESAAMIARTSLSDFVRRKAIEAAEIEIMTQNVVTIPAADWERFEAWVNEPAKVVPGLAELAARKPVWET